MTSWEVVNGQMTRGTMTNDKWQMTNGKWQMTNDNWLMANDKCQILDIMTRRAE